MSVRILIAEDDADLRDLLQDDLEDAGYETVVAIDGRAAIAHIEREREWIDLLNYGHAHARSGRRRIVEHDADAALGSPGDRHHGFRLGGAGGGDGQGRRVSISHQAFRHRRPAARGRRRAGPERAAARTGPVAPGDARNVGAHRRRFAAHARDVQVDRPRRPRFEHGAHHRRIGHGQGIGRARDSRGFRTQRALSRSTAPPSPPS